jgi:hypothetical protein
MSDVESFHP